MSNVRIWADHAEAWMGFIGIDGLVLARRSFLDPSMDSWHSYQALNMLQRVNDRLLATVSTSMSFAMTSYWAAC